MLPLRWSSSGPPRPRRDRDPQEDRGHDRLCRGPKQFCSRVRAPLRASFCSWDTVSSSGLCPPNEAFYKSEIGTKKERKKRSEVTLQSFPRRRTVTRFEMNKIVQIAIQMASEQVEFAKHGTDLGLSIDGKPAVHGEVTEGLCQSFKWELEGAGIYHTTDAIELFRATYKESVAAMAKIADVPVFVPPY